MDPLDRSKDTVTVFRSGNGLVQELIPDTGHMSGPPLQPIFPAHSCKKRSHFRRAPHGDCSRAEVRTFDRISVEWVPLQPVEFSLPGNCPTSLLLPSTTSTAPLDTPSRYYSARPPSSRSESSKESCWSANGAPWRRASAKVSRSPRTHEQIRSSGGFW